MRRRTYVEDEVNTSPLLHHLDTRSEDGSAKVGSWVGQSSLEAVCPRGEVAVLGDNRHLVLVVGDDLGEFGLYELRAGRLVTKSLENSCGVVETALHDEEARGLWEPEKSTSQDDGPCELKTDWDTV